MNTTLDGKLDALLEEVKKCHTDIIYMRSQLSLFEEKLKTSITTASTLSANSITSNTSPKTRKLKKPLGLPNAGKNPFQTYQTVCRESIFDGMVAKYKSMMQLKKKPTGTSNSGIYKTTFTRTDMQNKPLTNKDPNKPEEIYQDPITGVPGFKWGIQQEMGEAWLHLKETNKSEHDKYILLSAQDIQSANEKRDAWGKSNPEEYAKYCEKKPKGKKTYKPTTIIPTVSLIANQPPPIGMPNMIPMKINPSFTQAFNNTLPLPMQNSLTGTRNLINTSF